jgi:hypothetical protein
MSVVISDISPAEVLGRLRGRIIDVHPGYPETIHLQLIDAHGGEWYFSTHDADYSPPDPDVLSGQTIVSVDQVGPLGNLTIGFSDGSYFRVLVEPQEREDDPVNWRLYTPEGLVLVWGPGINWRLKRTSDLV